MQNKKFFLFSVFIVCVMVLGGASAQEIAVDEMNQMSADAIADYDVQGSLFHQITELEQEKVLMQLEKERAQLDLELDRLAAEKIKLHMEIDTLSGRAEQQQQEIETQKAKLEAEADLEMVTTSSRLQFSKVTNADRIFVVLAGNTFL